MDRRRFEEIVVQSINKLPSDFREKLENVDVVVEDMAGPTLLRRMRLRSPMQLLGLYQGVPRTIRGTGYTLALPDKITVFQKPIEARCGNREKDIEVEIEQVIKHEIAHHFGLGDAALLRIEAEKRRRKRGN